MSYRPLSLPEEDAVGIKQLQVYSQTRWDPIMRDEALRLADSGTMLEIARMCDAMRADGLISGIMGTLTSGLIRLPPKYTGDPYLVDLLRGREPVFDEDALLLKPGKDSVFWRCCPETEQIRVLFDGILSGTGLGELVPQADGSPPVLKALDIHWLRYRYYTDTWHYTTATGGDYLIEPGDGRWVFYTPYGRRRPWVSGLWWPCALPFISKQNSAYDRLRWQAQLADPLKVIEAGEGADEKHRGDLIEFIRHLWRRAAGLVTPPKYVAKLVESNGRGYEVYQEGEKRADIDLQVALTGQLVTTSGTNGLGGNGAIWETIKLDKIQSFATTWMSTLRRDMIEPWALRYHGTPRGQAPNIMLDARSPAQRREEAEALKGFAEAVIASADMLMAIGGDEEIDLEALLKEHSLTLPRRKRTRPLPQLSVVKPPKSLPKTGTDGTSVVTEEPAPKRRDDNEEEDDDAA